MAAPFLRDEVDDAVATITIDRPDMEGAMTYRMPADTPRASPPSSSAAQPSSPADSG